MTIQANWLERGIAAVAPSWAASRAVSRLKFEHVTRSQRFLYEGAKTGRRSEGWLSSNSDANVELSKAITFLRDRSRDLTRNNPYAVKAVEELVGNSVGTGITPQAKTGNQALDKIIDTEWPFFAEKCDPGGQMDFYGMQALNVRTTAESGESIGRFRFRRPSDGLRVPMQVQLLEADFLDHTRTGPDGANEIIQGVEFDVIGRRVAYWLYNVHPGALATINRGILSKAIPAEEVMHTYRVLRPGQVRGVPWLAPVMMALRDLDDYADAERVRKKIEACLAAFVIQPETEPTLGPTTTESGKLIEAFEPGMVTYLKNGSDVKMNNPAPAGGYREYKVTELQAISSGTGVPYEMLASDMSNTTYSSWRGSQLGFRNTVDGYRWLTVIPGFCNPTYRRFIDVLVMLGKIPAKAASDPAVNIYGVQWTAPKWESVDPLKDSKAELQKIRTGTETLFSSIAANGYDPRTHLQQIAQTNSLLDALKIVLDSDPRYTNIRGAEQPGDTNPSEPGRQGPKTATNADEDPDEESTERRWDSRTRRYV